jgi:NitT/TauT family transport system ATP-binding protein
MSEKVIEIEGLYFSYNGSEVILDNVNFSVEKGEKIALMGGSGKGKSTLLKLIASYERIPQPEVTQKNSIKIKSENVSYGNPDKAVSYLPQAAYKALFPWKTVRENVYYPVYLRYKDLSRKTIMQVNQLLGFESRELSENDKNRITASLESKFGNQFPRLISDIRFCNECIQEFNLKHKLNDYPLTLSGGEQKRLSVIMALSVNPEIVILDEPFAGLDFKTTEQLWKFLRRYFTENKTTALLVTHSVDEAAVMADKVVFLNREKKIAPLLTDNFKKYADELSGSEKQLLDNPGELLLHPVFNNYRKKIREEYENECTE